MNIGSVLYRLSPVQGTYRSINHEYKWVLRGCNGDSPPGLQHRTTGLPNYTARAAAALIRRGNILADLYALREGFVLYVLGPSVGNSGKK